VNSEHSLRWKSAFVMLAVIALVGVINNHFITWAFLGGVSYFAYLEATKLFKVESSKLLIPIAITWLAAFFITPPLFLIFILLLVLASKMAYDKSITPKEFAPVFYPFASMLFIWNLYIDYGMKALVWLLVIVALSDVGAYYAGRRFGKTPFSPTSPKKTMEGVYGGVLLATIIGALVISNSSDMNFLLALVIAALTSIAGVFGDLFESYLKREAGVKDSGDLIPGHGGMLDRIDGYLFAGVMLYVILEIIGR